MLWDVFISHASEDKTAVARPLAERLREMGLRVWLDEAQLRVGDSLRAKIDEGLAQSRYGVVILSHAFFEKRWPQRELGALFSRPNAVLPVWHNLRADVVASLSPMLADVVAASTEDGLDRVAVKIVDVTGRRRTPGGAYTSRLGIRPERISRALEVIESLSNPRTWPQLEVTAHGYPDGCWMGTASSTLIEILYGFAAPLVEYRHLAYAARRNIALLDGTTRLHFALLEAAASAVFNEVDLATLDPPIEYTPRVPGWRAKRLSNPQRYWWQGFSADRFDDAASFFLRSSKADPDADSLVLPEEFFQTYRRIYESSDRSLQQPLGLLANSFYGFTPKTRPVLWRLCVTLACLYCAALKNTHFDPDRCDVNQLELLYQPKRRDNFPFQSLTPVAELYEPHEITLDVSLRYLKAFSLPRLRAYLSAARELVDPSRPH
jgi:hypothetical protein